MDKGFRFNKTEFPNFFSRLQSFGTVYAPVSISEESYAYKAVEHPDAIAFEAIRTILPPKKFLYPPREKVFSYDSEGTITESQHAEPPLVIFGVHPCDLSGMKILDKIFMEPPGDLLYIVRRQNILVVGTSCLPDKYCFCNAMGTDQVKDGYDLFLTDLGDSFFVQVASARGAHVLAEFDGMSAANEADEADYKQFWLDREQLFTNRFSTTNLPALLDLEWNHPVWEDLGNRCLSCGNCTFVCPTCYCFDLVDVAQLNGSGDRVREWDSCQFTGFAKVAGDYNFRPGPIDRLKFWYRHKLHGFEDPAEIPTCVGCGRCTVSCPAGIDDIVGVVVTLETNRPAADGERSGGDSREPTP